MTYLIGSTVPAGHPGGRVGHGVAGRGGEPFSWSVEATESTHGGDKRMRLGIESGREQQTASRYRGKGRERSEFILGGAEFYVKSLNECFPNIIVIANFYGDL